MSDKIDDTGGQPLRSEPRAARSWSPSVSAKSDDTGGQREIPRAIAWYDGMPLYPQQFLEAELRSERLLGYHAALLSPFHWGLRTIEIDAERLRIGDLWVKEIDAVMPDGLAVFRSCSGPTRDEALHLPLIRPKGGAPFKVYLAVRRARVDDAQLLATGGTAGQQGARYRREVGVSVAASPPGMPTFSSAGPVDEAVDPPRLLPRLTLTQSPGLEHVSLPIAEISWEKDRGFFETSYVPPVPRLTKDGPARLLVDEIETLVKKIGDRAQLLLRQAKDASTSSEGLKVAELKNKARALAAFWPMLNVALRSGAPDPYGLYVALTAAAGHAAGADDDVLHNLLLMPIQPYRHEEIRKTFDGMMRDVFKAILDSTAQQRFDAYQLPYDKEKLRFSIRGNDLPAKWHTRKLVLEVRCSQSAAPGDCRTWMDRARICAESQLDSLESRRLPGVGRKQQKSVADELYESLGVLFFELKSEDQSEFLVSGEALVVLHPQENDRKEPTPTRPEELWLHVEREEVKHAQPEGSPAYRSPT